MKKRRVLAVLRCGLILVLLGIGRRSGAQDVDPAELVQLEEQAIQRAAASAAPWVVRIETLGGLETVGRQLTTQGPTTGVIVSPDGYILSSAFNFVQMPASILVTLPDGKRHPAKLVARDQSRMLVLLKVKVDQALPTPTIVDRDELRVGQWAIGLGRTYDGTLPSVSAGIISATNRVWGRAVQTDVKVSPANYGGPLIDLRGRLIGILVPLSPRAQSAVAGAEWYDSGIGFAVPLSDVVPHLEKLKAGEDLHPGLMGISLKGTNIYADRAELAAVAPKSPAAEAGLKPGDVIVEVDGQSIARQAQLKHALGPKYAGETVHVVVERGDDKSRHEFDVKLAKEILPYAHAFLGVLPSRVPEEKGVRVRWVYPESPAAAIGLKAGDVIEKIGDQAVSSAVDAQQALVRFEPEATVTVTWMRDGETSSAEAKLAVLPSDIPETLDPAPMPAPEENAEPLAAGVSELKIPEEPNVCHVYIPANTNPNGPLGLLVWISEGADFDPQTLEKEWGALAKRYHFMVLAPRPKDRRWAVTDVDFVHKAVDEAVARYPVDETRVVVGGVQTGGALSFLVALPRRDRFHGIMSADAPLPPRTSVPANEPTQRVALLLYMTEGTRSAALVDRTAKAFESAKYPVTLVRRNQTSAKLTDEQRAQLIRWADTLDRF